MATLSPDFYKATVGYIAECTLPTERGAGGVCPVSHFLYLFGPGGSLVFNVWIRSVLLNPEYMEELLKFQS